MDWVPSRLAVQVAGDQTWEVAAEVSLSTATAHGPTMRGHTLAYTADLLRDLFGNPFWTAPAIDRSWLMWNDGTVRKLAQTAYDERHLPGGILDTARLAVLADALEEAGCKNEGILSHLRQQGTVHVRGCWAIDCLLEKT